MFCTRVLIYSEDDSEEETSDSEESVGTCNSPSSYRQPGGRGTVVVEEVLYTVGLVFSCFYAGLRVPRPLWLSCKYSNSLSGLLWPPKHATSSY